MDMSRLAFEQGGVPLAAPCVAVTLALDSPEWPGVLDFYEKSRAALGAALTHVTAESRRGPVKLTAREGTMVPTWAKNPRAGKSYYASFAGASEGTSAASLTLSLAALPEPTPDLLARRADNWRVLIERGTSPSLQISLLRVTFPLDHPLAAPDKLLSWVLDLDLVQRRPFAAGYAGVALNHAESIGSSTARAAMERHLAVTCTRHPGLDWFTPGSLSRRILAFDALRNEIVPLVKRADWLVLLGDRTLGALGGAEKLTSDLGQALPAGADFATLPLSRGLCVRTGAAPDPLDPARDGLPLTLRALARVLRPVRLPSIDGPAGVPEGWVTDWLTVFDTAPGEA